VIVLVLLFYDVTYDVIQWLATKPSSSQAVEPKKPKKSKTQRMSFVGKEAASGLTGETDLQLNSSVDLSSNVGLNRPTTGNTHLADTDGPAV
jgi:hypothetical protein